MISGVYTIDSPIFADRRGFVKEVARLAGFKPKQLTHSYSNCKVLRGLHAHPFAKLVYPLSGSIFVALVDIRPRSKTFGEVNTFRLGAKNREAVFIPKGVANSYVVTSNKPVHYIYLFDEYYDGSGGISIAWDDPDLKISWPTKRPILSKKDSHNPTMRQLFPRRFK